MPSPNVAPAGGLKIEYSDASVPTLRAFSKSDAFIRGIMGPFGSGKSTACVIDIVEKALAQAPGPDGVRRSRWAVIRNTYPELRDTTMATVFQWLPPQYFGRHYVADHRFVVKGFKGVEFEIIFRALEREEDAKHLLSLELTGAWVNEAREIPWPIIEALQARVGRFPPMRDGGATWDGIIMDTNPPDSDSRWFKFFEEGKRGEATPVMSNGRAYAELFKQPGGLSLQAENLPNLKGGRLYYERLAFGKNPEWIKVYIDGQYGFIIDGRPVFPEYNDRLHCTSGEPIEGAPIYRGWDFGLTPACSFSQILPSGQWLIFDEMTSEEMGIDKFSDEVLEHCSRAFPLGAEFIDIGDPAGEQRTQTDMKTCFEIMHAKGIEIEGGDQSLQIRLESLKKPLRTLARNGEPQLILHPRCKVLRKGFLGAYNFRKLRVNGDRFTSKPDKNFQSHIMDATGYVATRLFGGGLTKARGEGEPEDTSSPSALGFGPTGLTGYG